MNFLERQQLPRFRRLKTRWLNLGPLLAHAGIPRSCLPEFFERVLPRAEECAAAEDEAGFEQLLASLPSLYLTKPTERFLLYGEQIARDFLKRSVELRRLWLTNGTVPEAKTNPFPDRVVLAFKEWTERSQSPAGVSTARRSLRRPVLRLDILHGLVLELPSQRLESGESLVSWIVEPDAGTSIKVDSRSEPGERVTAADECFLPAPFASLKVRLFSGRLELATWVFDGILRNKPVLFFAAEDLRVIPHRLVEAGLTGIAHPSGWRLVGYAESKEMEPPVSASLGLMPFGWRELDAKIYDLTDLDQVELRNSENQPALKIEIAEVEAFRARLRNTAGEVESARDVDMVFFGWAPTLEIWKAPHQSTEEFLSSWIIELRAAAEIEQEPVNRVVQLRDLQEKLKQVEGSAWYCVPTSCEELLGSQPWGQFELFARGPIGQDARFSFRVLPQIRITHDWSEWSDHPDQANVTIRIPGGVRLRGACATDDPREYFLETHGQTTRLHLELEGFQNRRFDLPLDVQVPLPAWALYTPDSGRPLVNWSRKPLSLSVDEIADTDTVLLAKLATPWGIPSGVTVCLAGPSGDLRREPVEVDALGNCKFELRPYIANARQYKLARLDLIFELALRRTVRLTCGSIHRQWAPESFSCDIHDATTVFCWKERVRVQNRAIKIDSLLTPWVDPQLLEMPDAPDGIWQVASNQVWGAPGLYRVTLGLQDPWSGNFEPAPGAVKTVEVGNLSDWTRSPLFSDLGSDGYLFRILLEHHTDQPVNLGHPELLPAEDGQRLATRVLSAYSVATTDSRGPRLRAELDRVLRRLPVEHLLGTLAAHSTDLDPKLILGARLFARGWDHVQPKGITCGVPLTDLQMESLWRGWKPLGVWAELQLLDQDPGAESRVLQHLGKEQLELLTPVQRGGSLSFRCRSLEKPVKARIRQVATEHELNPFDVSRVGPGVTLDLLGEFPPEFNGVAVTASRDSTGRWVFQNSGSEDLPSFLKDVIACDLVELSTGKFYPEPAPLLSKHPEPPVVDLIRRGDRAVLEAIQAYCSRLPSSPISPEAFQDACFQWCLRAVGNITYRDELKELCREWAVRVADDVASRRVPDMSPAQWRALCELRSRWYPNAQVEPLYAVNYLAWAVALAVIWRGLARNAPFTIREGELADLSLRIFELIPELLEHDLVKMCAIEALDRSSNRQPWH